MKKITFVWIVLLAGGYFVTHTLSQTQAFDSRAMSIPDLDSSEALANLPDSILLDLSQLRLHYRVGAYEKAASLFYTRSDNQNDEASRFGYLGIEPVSFSKPSESLYQKPIGWWGGNLYDAVQDHRESKRILQAYRVRAITSDVLFVAGALAGLITVSGMFADVPFWGQNDTDLFGQKGDCLEQERDSNGEKTGRCIGGYETQLGFNFLITFSLFTGSLIPKLFNRGKIQKAVYLYNKQYQR